MNKEYLFFLLVGFVGGWLVCYYLTKVDTKERRSSRNTLLPTKKPIYFKLKHFSNVFIKVVEHDENYYDYVTNNGYNGWDIKKYIEPIKNIEKMYERLDFDPLK